MNLKFNNLLKLFFGLSVIFLLGISYFTFDNINNLVQNEKYIANTNAILFNLENVISTMKDAETGQRGYLLTRDKQFLEPYYGAYDKVMNYHKIIKEQTREQVMQQMRLDTLKKLVDARFVSLQERIDVDSSKDNEKKLSYLRNGKRDMDKIREIIGRMKDSELEMLNHRITNAEESSNVTYIVAGIFTFLSVIIILVSYLFTTNELQKRERLEVELSESVQSLKTTNENLEQFAYVASHDLQEPLRKIRAFGDLLKSDFGETLPEQGSDYINRMQNAAVRMQILINDLLNFSRASRNVGEPETVKIGSVINNVLSDLDITIKDEDAIVNVHIDKDAAIQANRTQINQLFQNLISNAIKFHKKGVTPEVNITGAVLSSKKSDHGFELRNGITYYKVEVKDNGIGFDTKYLDKIFVIFQRLHSKTEYKGTGIGLALCKKIVENHKGFITAESKPGEGSTFTAIFPINNNLKNEPTE